LYQNKCYAPFDTLILSMNKIVQIEEVFLLIDSWTRTKMEPLSIQTAAPYMQMHRDTPYYDYDTSD